MARRISEWTDLEIELLLLSVRKIPVHYWEQFAMGARSVKSVPVTVKHDLVAVLTTINFVVKGQLPLAVDRFRSLSARQNKLLTSIKEQGNKECQCSQCSADKIEDAEVREGMLNLDRLLEEDVLLLMQEVLNSTKDLYSKTNE